MPEFIPIAATNSWIAPFTYGQASALELAQYKPSGSSQSLLFIDSTVADIDVLIRGSKSSNIFILDSNRDGVDQIIETLAQFQDVGSVHIVSHGDAGSLRLGNATLSSQTIPYYGLMLQSIAQNLTADADILFYGCDVGFGEAGLSFLNSIAQLTGANVAASNNRTGNPELGGDWNLEVHIGSIKSDLIFQNETLLQYSGILPFISDLSWAATPTNGWGPVERDRSNGEQGATDGGVLTLNSVTYSKGLGVHASSDITYTLNSAYSRFTSDVGVDDSVGSRGSVTFQVWADGTQLFDSGLMTGATATRSIDVNVTGRQSLRLVVTDGGNGVDFDHGNWANAQLIAGTPTPDTTPPTVALSGALANVTISGTSVYDFSVAYTDNQAINFSTIDANDVRVTGPNSFSQLATLVSATPTGNGTPRTATYRITAPGGTWDTADNGVYTVALQASQVTDTSGNAVPLTTLGTFQATLTPPPPDTTPPTASLTAPLVNVTTSGASTYDFSVLYTDNQSVNFSTIDSNDVRITGPNGFNQLGTLVSVTPVGNGTPRTAIYRITPPGGTWDITDNGTYSVALLAVQVTDLSGNAISAATLGSFQANISSFVSTFISDLSWVATPTNGWGPVERDRSNGESAAGDGGVLTLNGVTYSKGLGVHAGSEVIYALNGAYTRFTSDIGVDDAVGSNGSVTFEVWVDGNRLFDSGLMIGTTATRSVDVNVTGGQNLRLVVTNGGDPVATANWYDHADWANAQLIAGTPTPDTTPPTVSLLTPLANVTTSGTSTYDFTVAYTDNQSINVSTIDGTDVRVTGPNSFSQLATLVSITPTGNGTPRTATYRITAPGGTWDTADNGTYTVALQASQVTDTSGNAVPAATLGTFQATLTPPPPDTTAPTATLTAATLDTSRTTPYTFTVAYTDATAVNASTINSSDVRVTGPNGYSQLAQLVSVTPTGNGTPLTATYQITAPDTIWNWNDRGTYTATLVTGEVRDTLGNTTIADTALGTFQVSVSSTIVLGVNSSQVTEGGTVTIPIQRVGDTTGSATITYFTGGNSTAIPNVNYVPIPVTTLTFAPGEATKNVVVQTLDDGVSGTSRTVSLLIETPTGADLGPSRTSSISIVDRAAATRTYLSDLNWATATNGWGPTERDRSNGENGAGDGTTLTLNGVTYSKGLGVHASSDITYTLGGTYNSFFAYLGVDDEVSSNGSVIFQVFADGTPLFDSGVMTGNSATRLVNVDVTGRQSLRLVVTNGGDNVDYDHANWADAQLVVGSYTPPPPTQPPAPPPPTSSFTRESVATGLIQPTTFDWSPDGSLMFIAEKGGIVRVSVQGTGASPQFTPFQQYATGTNAHSVTSVDLNGDGRLDLAVANSGNNTVSVLFGRGDGTFNAAANYGVGSAPKSVFAADINGDGRPDLLTANQDSNNISVLINNGNGTYATAVNYAGPTGAHEVVAADIDGDGDLDIAATGWGGTVVSIFRNNGNGTFAAATNYTVGSNPHSLQLVDFNGDGRPDLAVASLGSNAASILLNSGTGTFGSVVNYTVGSRPHSIRAADLNGDGRIDLVTANDGDASASVLLGNGNGTFASAVRYATGSVPKGVAIGDINGDGRLDIVTANTAGNYPSNSNNPGGNTVSVLLGNGNGTFAAPIAYMTGNTPFNLALADFNGDGRLDIATANWFSNNVGVLLNTTVTGTTGLQADPFIDISSQVNNVADRGLLGLAVDPFFGQNQGRDYVYLLYTYDPPETQGLSGLAGPDGGGNRPARLIRVTANPATNYRTALPNSQVILLGANSLWQYTSRPDVDSTDNFVVPPSGIVNGTTITAPAGLIEDADAANVGRDYTSTDTNFDRNNNIRDYLAGDSTSHSIGQIKFGLDGALYVTVGDGTSYNGVDWRSLRVQDVDNLSGKLLRINPLTGQGFTDNPFYNGNLDSNRSKVWSSGLRNTFRFTVQPGTGAIYMADVGWNNWEEVNVATRGGNFGWPYFEGSPQNTGYSSLPQAQAFYNSGQTTVTPLIARNHTASQNLDGRATTALIMGDFYSGNTYPSVYNGALFYNDVGLGTVYATFLNANGTVNSTQVFDNLQYIVDMETGPDGNLYYASLYGGEVGRWRFA